MFAHEKLRVYGKAVDFAAKATAWTSSWDKKHALVSRLRRPVPGGFGNPRHSRFESLRYAKRTLAVCSVRARRQNFVSRSCNWCYSKGNLCNPDFLVGNFWVNPWARVWRLLLFQDWLL